MVLIDKPGAAQSVIEVALVGAERKSPDYFPLTVMNMVFGGQFSSRLNLNLREEKGYTYGARSMFEWRVRQPGPFVATASVQTARHRPRPGRVPQGDRGHGRRPARRPPRNSTSARSSSPAATRPASRRPRQIAQQLETLFAYQLPDDYFNTVVPGVMAVTADDVLRVAKKYLPLDRLTVVVVGDRKAIEPALRKLPWART